MTRTPGKQLQRRAEKKKKPLSRLEEIGNNVASQISTEENCRILNGTGIKRNKNGKRSFPASVRKFLTLYFQYNGIEDRVSDFMFKTLREK